MIEAGFALKPDGEILLCLEHEPSFWATVGIVLVRGSTLSIANDTDILLEDQPILKPLATKLVAQGRVSVISTGADGTSVANECLVVERP